MKPTRLPLLLAQIQKNNLNFTQEAILFQSGTFKNTELSQQSSLQGTCQTTAANKHKSVNDDAKK